MLKSFCSFQPDYIGLLRSLTDPAKLLASQTIVQFPFTLTQYEEKTEEEMARLTEKRKEQGKKLQEMAAKMRSEKVNPTLCTLTQLKLFL